jgi:hypothetical protein
MVDRISKKLLNFNPQNSVNMKSNILPMPYAVHITGLWFNTFFRNFIAASHRNFRVRSPCFIITDGKNTRQDLNIFRLICVLCTQ